LLGRGEGVRLFKCRGPWSNNHTADPAEGIQKRWGINKPERSAAQKAKLDIPITVILGLFPFGYQMLKFPYPATVGAISWAVCLLFCGRVMWLWRHEHRGEKILAFA